MGAWFHVKEGLSAISIDVMQTCSVQALQEQLYVLAAAKKEKKPENIHGKKSEDSENSQNNRNGKDSEWRNHLSLSQERHLEKEMNHLEDKKRHEEQYALKDGPEQLQEMHAEYVRKESDVLKSYQRKAEHNLRGDPKEGSSEQPKPVEELSRMDRPEDLGNEKLQGQARSCAKFWPQRSCHKIARAENIRSGWSYFESAQAE